MIKSVKDDRFYRPANAPISPLDILSGVLLEHEESMTQALAEGTRECIDCGTLIDILIQERNGGRCDECAGKNEHGYWESNYP